jgi:hypothetical protein
MMETQRGWIRCPSTIRQEEGVLAFPSTAGFTIYEKQVWNSKVPKIKNKEVDILIILIQLVHAFYVKYCI